MCTRRASTRCAASGSANPTTPTPTAASITYAIPEIKQRILTFLPRASLPVMMRVEKKGMYAVAKEVYSHITYKQAQSALSKSAARKKLYSEAVIEIDARSIILPPSLRNKLPSQLRDPEVIAMAAHDTDTTWDSSEFELDDECINQVQRYSPESFTLVVTPLRKKYPSLNGYPSGIGERTRPPTHGSSFSADASYHPLLLPTLPSELVPGGSSLLPPGPSGDYVVHQRINLDLDCNSNRPPRTADWLAAVQQSPCLADLYDAVDLHNLPIPLAGISEMYQRQIASGYTTRLARIRAIGTKPWDIHEFRSFSLLASASLTNLSLFTQYPDVFPADIKLSFADLPDLISIIRGNLPNLREMTIAMRGIETAEEICKGMLSERTLDDGGTIEYLRIVTTHRDTALFNVVRALSPLCVTPPNVSVENGGSAPWEWPRDQSKYLEYLRKQTLERRRHLSTVDFASIDITDPAEIQTLDYDEDGRPLSKSAKWAKDAKETAEKAAVLLPQFQAGLKAYAELSERFNSTSSTVSPAERVKGAQELLQASRALETTAGEVLRLSINSAPDSGEIGLYVESLKEV